MRRLALLLILGTSAIGIASPRGDHAANGGTAAYLAIRSQNKIVQPVGVAALRDVVKPRIFELQGKVVGTCRAGETTLLLFQRADGETQEVESKNVPDWLATSGESVRMIVRCSRSEKSSSLKTTMMSAAPEVDVLPVEEAYWRSMAAKRKAASAPSSKPASQSSFSNVRGRLYGQIGSRSASTVRRDWILPASEVTPQYAAFIRGRNPRLPANDAYRIAQAIVGFSQQYGVDARLVMAMLIVESGFDPNAVSRSGAVGLGQLMPGTARWMGVHNSYDTTDNLFGTVKLLRTHLDQYRTQEGFDLPRTLAAYNAGAGAVARHGGVPPYRETQAYVRKVTEIFRKLRGY